MKRSFKVEVTPEAHRAIKLQCALDGVNAKSYVSNLILNSIDKRISEILKATDETKFPENRSETYSENSYETENGQKNQLLNHHNPMPKCISPNTSFSQTSQVVLGNAKLSEERLEDKFDRTSRKASIKTCQVYDIMPSDPEKAQTIDEIARISNGISKPMVQSVLYWLLKEGMVKRELREDPEDKRNNSWEYWKLSKSITLKKRGIAVNRLLEILPAHKEQAKSIHELANTLDVPPSTIRDAIKRLELDGQIISLVGANGKNQATMKFYCAHPSQS